MTLQAILEPFGDGLSAALAAMATPVPCYHYFRYTESTPWVVWQEDGDNSQRSDNAVIDQGISGTIDLYTKTEYDSAADVIQTFLNDYGASWYLNSVQFEDETRLIHHEWVFEVV